jgi:hypothetical protein
MYPEEDLNLLKDLFYSLKQSRCAGAFAWSLTWQEARPRPGHAVPAAWLKQIKTVNQTQRDASVALACDPGWPTTCHVKKLTI